ncbi:MAG: hypothetical protein J6A16_12310 [Oscillospiraceae bacterium]|nr:hypothetical protein [Oscillospiraceae bacterium]
MYTFASPRTTVVDASIAKSYDYIFNIVNEDDIVTELPFKQWGFIRYGEDISISILNKYKSQWNSLANEQVKYNTDIEWRKNLVDEMALLSNNERNGCYKYTCECEHGDKTDDSITMGLGLFKDEIAYAKPYRTVTEGEHVCETVTYFMHFLSYLAANGGDNITIIFTDVSPKYESVKSSFIRYYICQNMETPHHQLSYFLLSRCL